MKWGRLYGPDYVNVLYNSSRSQITGDFRFVCLTDDATGINKDVETYPIPDIGLEEKHWRRGCWPKISLFKEDLHGLQGRALFIDLDTVLWGAMDDFFTFGEGFVAIDSRPWRYKSGAPRTMSSIFAFDLGSMNYLVEKLMASRDALIPTYSSDQEYIADATKNISYWPDEWIRSFKYHLRQPLILDRFRSPKQPGPQAKALCFHGKPRPIDLIIPPKSNWDVFPHYGKGKVAWMVDYWLKNGGRIQE
jgi:hypothetical protein